MDSRREEFYKNLIIDEEDKVRAEKYLTSKGVEKHIILKEKLFNWIEGDKIEYSLIASIKSFLLKSGHKTLGK